MKCPHKIRGKCELTKLVIGEAVKPHPSACESCQGREPYRRMAVNTVVIGISAGVMKERYGVQGYWQTVKRFHQLYQPTRGVGTELEKIIHKWLGFFLNTKTDACDCQAVKEIMDRNGPAYCRRERNMKWIVDKLEANHRALRIPIPFVRSIAIAAVKTACKRAERLPPLDAPLPAPLLTVHRPPSSADRLVQI